MVIVCTNCASLTIGCTDGSASCNYSGPTVGDLPYGSARGVQEEDPMTQISFASLNSCNFRSVLTFSVNILNFFVPLVYVGW